MTDIAICNEVHPPKCVQIRGENFHKKRRNSFNNKTDATCAYEIHTERARVVKYNDQINSILIPYDYFPFRAHGGGHSFHFFLLPECVATFVD